MTPAEDLKITPVPAFNDNYLWLLARGQQAAVVDPGDAAPVLQALDDRKLTLAAILVTHHHADHAGGVVELKERHGSTVFGPAGEKIAGVDHRLVTGDHVDVLGTGFSVIDVPGHTAGHIAYYAPDAEPPLLFCGDTLFACGCGRLFEGTPQQMLASLDSLAALPSATRVYCAHEYTLANIRFALAVEPGNAELQRRQTEAHELRQRGEPTLPSTMGLELATNPFLRCDEPAVRAAVARRSPGTKAARVATFAALREWKNGYA
jgi:hydroxyacylglutathione hydrolase